MQGAELGYYQQRNRLKQTILGRGGKVTASETPARSPIFPAVPNTMANLLNPKRAHASRGLRRGLRVKAGSVLYWAAVLVVIGTVMVTGRNPSWGEEASPTKLLFLVARPSINDPLFAKSVILMLELKGEPLVVGLIINKPTQLHLNELFPKSRVLKKRVDTAYLGGPVDTDSAALVFHSSKPYEQAMLLYDDVYVSFDLKFISARLRDPEQRGDLRLFLGRAQWAPKQLQAEAFRGSWYSLRAQGDVIFEKDSEHLWQRLHDLARSRSNAQNFLPEGPPEQFQRPSSGYLRLPPLLPPSEASEARTGPLQ
jgi:putative transcriptional regulator